MTTLLDEIVAEEGCIDHLYLDTRGNVTCGVGRLIKKIGEIGNYTWSDHVAALKDFALLQELKRDCKYGMKWPATRYAPLTRARMSKPREGLVESIEQIDKQLGNRFPWFDGAPRSVQEALIDMVYNLGLTGLTNEFPKMLRALALDDYTGAAPESHRKGISDARNQRTYNRIQSGNTTLGNRPGR